MKRLKMKKCNSKLNKKSKILILVTILTIIIFLLLIFPSCSKTTSDDSLSESSEVKSEGDETDKSESDIQEEIIESVKGEDLTDYDNVKADAEIKGAVPGFLCTNKDNIITIEIKNTSDFTWRNDSVNSVRVGYHYYGQDVDASDYDSTTRTELDKNVEPGETIKVNMLINDIEKPGNYVIQIDMVLEGKYWFSSKGVAIIESPAYFGECTNQ
jgi:hypothetical protein